MISRKGLRRSLKDWFGSLEPNLYLTHNFGFRAAAETRDKSLKRFYNRMQRRVHGRNWNKRETGNFPFSGLVPLIVRSALLKKAGDELT